MSADPVAPTTEATSVPAQETPAKDQEIGHKVYVGNLASETTEEGLRAFFAPVASDIVTVQVIHPIRGNHYGFVAVTTQAAAEKAVAELHQQKIGEQVITVELARPAGEKRPRKTKGGNKRRFGRRGGKAPPGEVTEAEANGEGATTDDAAPATEADGKPAPAKARKPKKPLPLQRKKKTKPTNGEVNGDPAVAATSEGESAPPTEKAEKAEKKIKPKREPRPRRTPRAEGEEPTGEPSKTNLFVANLSYSIDEAGLKEIFTAEGFNVVNVHVVRKRIGKTQRSRGYGFVEVGNEEEQKQAIEKVHDKEVSGRRISVKVALHKDIPTADEAAPATEAPTNADVPAAVAS